MVQHAAAALGVDARAELIEVCSEADAMRLRFLGSPTVRVNGRDVEPGAVARTDYALSCRMYGRTGVPSREWIKAALRSASEAAR